LGKQQNTALLWTGENKVCRAAIYFRRDGRDFLQNHAQHLHVDGRGSVALCKNRKYDQNQSFGSRSDLETVHGSEREKVSRAGPPGRETSAVSVRARFKTSKINSQRVYPTAGFLATDNLDLVQKCLAGRDPASELSSDPRIEAYLRFSASNLLFSDDPIDRHGYLNCHLAYSRYRQSGSQESRFQTWRTIQEVLSRRRRNCK
jgi:hypothetical protein